MHNIDDVLTFLALLVAGYMALFQADWLIKILMEVAK